MFTRGLGWQEHSLVGWYSVHTVQLASLPSQVFAVRSGGATGVVVKGPDDRNPISFR